VDWTVEPVDHTKRFRAGVLDRWHWLILTILPLEAVIVPNGENQVRLMRIMPVNLSPNGPLLQQFDSRRTLWNVMASQFS